MGTGKIVVSTERDKYILLNNFLKINRRDNEYFLHRGTNLNFVIFDRTIIQNNIGII